MKVCINALSQSWKLFCKKAMKYNEESFQRSVDLPIH